MNDTDRDKISSNLPKLVLRTSWNDKLESSLVEKNVFKQKMINDIKSETKDQEMRIRQLYLDVQKRGPKAFRSFVLSLDESDNSVAANILDPEIKPRTLPSPLADDVNNKVWNLPSYSVEGEVEEKTKFPKDSIGPPIINCTEPLAINVKPATQYRGPPDMRNVYPMTKKQRGLCLIIDNEKFDNDVLPFREGSRIDANNLDILFQNLGFNVILRRNLKYQDMMSTLNNFTKMPEHNEGEMCVIALLSHGQADGLINAADGRPVPTEYVLRRFNNEGCPALKGKPKFFILQACRGDDADFGTIPTLETQESTTCQVDAKGFVFDSATAVQTIAKDPTWEDMVILYATIPGYVANRNLYRGTWLIECLCYVFMNHACEMDLREMLDEVARRLKNYESENGFKQSCSYENRHFYNKLYFNPGIVRDRDRPRSFIGSLQNLDIQ